MTKNELRFKVNDKYNKLEDSKLYWEDAIREVINILIDYENETNDWKYDSYTTMFLHVDDLESYIQHRIKTFGPAQAAKDMEGIDSDDDYYKVDDVFGDISTLSDGEVSNWIGDILDDIGFPDEEVMLNDLTELLKHKVEDGWAHSMDELYYQGEIWQNRHQGYEFSDGIHAIVEQIADENKWFLDEDNK